MKPISFARIVWADAPHAPVFASANLSVQLVTEVFGPPDVRGTVARWSFADESRKVRCAIVARADAKFKSTTPMPMQFVASAKLGRAFFEWATERISLTHNGELPPAFVMSR